MKAPAIPVIYEDNHLLVVIKPEGIPVQEDRTGDPDMLTLLKQDLKCRHGKPGNVFLGLVHRLDRPVGGVMVFAKTSKGASRLSAQIRERTFAKYYLAAVQGCPEPLKHRLEHWLLKDRSSNTVRVVRPDTAQAQNAVLEYEVVGQGQRDALVRIRLVTGRPHQIRVQLAAIGHPLRGDTKYGAVGEPHRRALELWSESIAFQHPTRKETLRFETPPESLPCWIQGFPSDSSTPI